MLDRLLQKFGTYKIIAPLLAAGIISAPLPAYSEDLFSRDMKKQTFNLQEEGSDSSLEQRIFPGIALHLETQPRPSYLPPEEPTSSDEKQKTYYISPGKTESGKKPDYLQPQGSYSPPPGYSSGSNGGCGTTCTVIGGVVAGVCGIFLIGMYTLDKDTEGKNNLYSKTVQEDKKSTGPILFGIGALGGLGLMIYGISTTD